MVELVCKYCGETRLNSSITCCERCGSLNCLDFVGTFSDKVYSKKINIEELPGFVPDECKKPPYEINLYKCRECNFDIAIIDTSKSEIATPTPFEVIKAKIDQLGTEIEKMFGDLAIVQKNCPHLFAFTEYIVPGYRIAKCLKCGFDIKVPCEHSFGLDREYIEGVYGFGCIQADGGQGEIPYFEIRCTLCHGQKAVRRNKYCSVCQKEGLKYLGRFCCDRSWQESKPKLEYSELPKSVAEMFPVITSYWVDLYQCPACGALIVIYDNTIYLK